MTMKNGEEGPWEALKLIGGGATAAALQIAGVIKCEDDGFAKCPLGARGRLDFLPVCLVCQGALHCLRGPFKAFPVLPHPILL